MKHRKHKKKFDTSCTDFIETARLREDPTVFQLFYKKACSQKTPTVVSLNAALRDIKKKRPSKMLLYTIEGAKSPCTS